MPWKDYYRLANRATAKWRKDTGEKGFLAGFLPVADGEYVAQHPFYPEPSPLAADIPMIVCSTFYERSPSAFDSSIEDISLDEAKELIKTTWGFIFKPLGDNTSGIIDAYAKTFPDRKPIEILSMVLSHRKAQIDVCNLKALQIPPVYLAWFGWNTPLFDGRLRAFHTMDIAFWFNNTDVQISHTGGGARPRQLAEKMSESLVNFMKTGNPNGGALPEWPEYSIENGETMILDDVCKVMNDPDREARKTLPE
jgi:para-nitrobenzyl esterase